MLQGSSAPELFKNAKAVAAAGFDTIQLSFFFNPSAEELRALATELKLEIDFHQSNREYEIIDWIHAARETSAAVIINPGAFTHTSVAILDALNAFDGFVFEVHISNVHKREAFRHHSYVSMRADGVMAGFGTQGYSLALRRVARLLDMKKD